jgi:hypothetical protein
MPNLQGLSGSRMCRCRSSSGDAQEFEVLEFLQDPEALKMEMFKHNVCVQDARTAQAMLPPFRRSCNITEIGQLFGPIQLLRVAKERRQSRWLSFYLSAAASIQKLRGVPCMTRVLHHGLPLRRSYHHHQHSLRKKRSFKTTPGCMPSYPTRLTQVPKNAHNKQEPNRT